jgi:cytochrome c553
MSGRLALIVAALALVVSLVALFRQQPAAPAVPAAEDPGELAPYMGLLQRYADKLYFAGRNANWPLADFYHHELEETAEEIIGAGFDADGHDVGPLMDAMLLPALQQIDQAVGAADAAGFESAYAALVQACNNCHQNTGYGFIRLTIPERTGYPNQDFAPAGRVE